MQRFRMANSFFKQKGFPKPQTTSVHAEEYEEYLMVEFLRGDKSMWTTVMLMWKSLVPPSFINEIPFPQSFITCWANRL